jgi:hypothetical protein
MAFGFQQCVQHPAPGEGIAQMQLTGTAHQRQIDLRGRARRGVDAAPADAERIRLPADARPMVAVDHRLALGSRPTLSSAPDKSFSSVCSRHPIVGKTISQIVF